MGPSITATPEILTGYCGPIEWALLDAPGPTTWRRGVWGPVGPSSEPEQMGVVRAGDMRGELAIRLPLSHPVAMCHAARWLATQLGMDPGSTAPGWARLEWEIRGDCFAVLLRTGSLCFVLQSGRIYTNGTGYNMAKYNEILLKSEIIAGVEAHVKSLNLPCSLPPFPETPDAS